jgi:hypothetical protein
LAYNNDIELIQVSTFVDFKRAIENNSRYFFDAIILDALGLIDTNDETPSLRALNEAINFINQHKSKEVLPYFILSGQLGNDEHSNVVGMLGEENIYYKTNDERKLLSDIKESMNTKQEAQLKYKYRDLLELCSDQFLGKEQFTRLFTLIKHIESEEKQSGTEDMLNPIRKIMERMFTRMAKKGIIPEVIISDIGWINGSKKFLLNEHSDFEHVAEATPPLVRKNFEWLLNITQDVSHLDGNLKLKVDQYLISAKSDFLYRSCIFLLFDLLLWFKEFIENNPDKDRNKARWKSKVSNGEWITGTISRIADNGWGTFQPDNAYAIVGIPPKMVKNNNLKENDSIKIIAEPSPDGSKTFIKTISKSI